MSNNLKLAFVIEAIDNATKKIRDVGAAVDKTREPMRRARAAAREFFEAAGVGRLREQLDAIRGRGAAFLETARGIAAGVAIMSAGAGAAFFGFKRVADETDRIADTAAALGMTAAQLQRMGFAAQMNGSSQDELAQSLVFLNKNMGEARNGSQAMLQMFRNVGITQADLRDSTFTAGDALERIADTFNRVGDAGNNAGKKVEVSTALLGRSGFRQIQFLNAGSAAMRRFYAEADRLGVTLGEQTVSNMGAFNDSFDRLRLTVFGAIANALGPAAPRLQEIVERVVEWTAANRGLIATRLGEFIERVATALPGFLTSVGQIAQVVFAFAMGADRVAQALGGWQVVLGAIAVLLATKVVVSFVTLMATIVGAVPYIIGVAKIFFWFAAGLASAFALPAAIAAGLIAAGAAVWAYWEPIGEFFSGLWDTLKRIGGTKITAAPAEGAPSIYAGAEEWARYRAGSALASGGQQLGGTLRIQVDGEGRARVAEVRKEAGSPLDLDVYTGAMFQN